MAPKCSICGGWHRQDAANNSELLCTHLPEFKDYERHVIQPTAHTPTEMQNTPPAVYSKGCASKESGRGCRGTVLMLAGSSWSDPNNRWKGWFDGGTVDWAEQLSSQGFCVAVLDSFGHQMSRRATLQCAHAMPIWKYRVHDTFNTLRFFFARSHRFPEPIHLLGKSNGGYVATCMLKRGGDIGLPDAAELMNRLGSVVLKSPYCALPKRLEATPPVLAFIGSEDVEKDEDRIGRCTGFCKGYATRHLACGDDDADALPDEAREQLNEQCVATHRQYCAKRRSGDTKAAPVHVHVVEYSSGNHGLHIGEDRTVANVHAYGKLERWLQQQTRGGGGGGGGDGGGGGGGSGSGGARAGEDGAGSASPQLAADRRRDGDRDDRDGIQADRERDYYEERG